MTPERTKELLPIIQAYAEGKTIQIKLDGKWKDAINLDFSMREYRIKPEPKVIYVNEYNGMGYEALDSKDKAESLASIGARPTRVAVRYTEASD